MPVFGVTINTVPGGIDEAAWKQQRILAAADSLLQAGTPYQHLHLPDFDPAQVSSGTGFPWLPVSNEAALQSSWQLALGQSGTTPNPYAAAYGRPTAGIDCTDFTAYAIDRAILCVPEKAAVASPKDLQGARIATSFPNITRKWLADRGVTVHLVELSGSVEVMISLGVADAIVDLVETGSTLAANQLRILDEIGRYETVLVQNRSRRHADLADRIVRRLEGVVIASSYSLLEYNIPRSRLAEAEKITPGFNSPTVSGLEDPDWCAVRALVRRGETHAIMERLEAIGASAIVETAITNCRL